MTLAYRVKNSLYLNITNRCHCACVFCIRKEYDGVGDGENLWLERDPTAQEVIESLKGHVLSAYDEIVFCGYGEPTERLDVLLEVCAYLKETAPQLPIRINTNGLTDLLTGEENAPRLVGLVDIVSISLNAPDAARYQEITRPASSLGEEAFEEMLRFARACKDLGLDVRFSVVDVITHDEIQGCQRLAQQEGIPLRVRQKA